MTRLEYLQKATDVRWVKDSFTVLADDGVSFEDVIQYGAKWDGSVVKVWKRGLVASGYEYDVYVDEVLIDPGTSEGLALYTQADTVWNNKYNNTEERQSWMIDQQDNFQLGSGGSVPGDTGYQLGGTAANASTGNDWNNPSNVLTDGTSTFANVTVTGDYSNNNRYKVLGTDSVQEFSFNFNGYKEVGDSNITTTELALGGTALGTPAQINSSSFGFGIRCLGTPTSSKYIEVTNFGFSIPTNAEVIGLKMRITARQVAFLPTIHTLNVYNMKINVEYRT